LETANQGSGFQPDGIILRKKRASTEADARPGRLVAAHDCLIDRKRTLWNRSSSSATAKGVASMEGQYARQSQRVSSARAQLRATSENRTISRSKRPLCPSCANLD